MAAGMAVVAGIQAVGAVKGYRDNKKAAESANRIDEQNIARMKEENAQTIERTTEQMQNVEAQGRVARGASSFGKGSAKDAYLTFMQQTHAKDLDWLKKSAASNVNIAESERAARYDINRRNATTGLIQGLGGAASSAISSGARFKDTNNNWWA
jgi:hypothetical protein